MSSQSFIHQYRGSKIKVTIEYPEQADKKTEQAFISCLKEIYLKKMHGGVS